MALWKYLPKYFIGVLYSGYILLTLQVMRRLNDSLCNNWSGGTEFE